MLKDGSMIHRLNFMDHVNFLGVQTRLVYTGKGITGPSCNLHARVKAMIDNKTKELPVGYQFLM